MTPCVTIRDQLPVMLMAPAGQPPSGHRSARARGPIWWTRRYWRQPNASTRRRPVMTRAPAPVIQAATVGGRIVAFTLELVPAAGQHAEQVPGGPSHHPTRRAAASHYGKEARLVPPRSRPVSEQASGLGDVLLVGYCPLTGAARPAYSPPSSCREPGKDLRTHS
jgi:hypothetical protein